MSFLADAVEAIHAHWAEISGLLDASAREELLEILADAESNPEAAADELRELIKPFTPPGHAVRQALTPSGVRFRPSAPQPDSDALLASLQALRTAVDAAPLVGTPHEAASPIRPDRAAPSYGPDPVAPSSRPDAVVPSYGPDPAAPSYGPDPAAPSYDSDPAAPPYRPDPDDAWLLAEPALPAASLDLAPEQAHDLILLTDGDEVARVPAFQLDPESGTPYPVVVEINRLLSADVDPWGAADWWLGPNVWLDAAPARLLGTGVDHALLSAARAEIPEW
ncbi:hypothetical protein [Streptomyces sp. SID3212]|uniref:hypothetical protein n=1 Tax=Streptomyces sp. SID3212 TaxID=2690259 RepID=UPI0013CD9B16|nr:hypothetical protein [Streptomyces sp. SID3212]